MSHSLISYLRTTILIVSISIGGLLLVAPTTNAHHCGDWSHSPAENNANCTNAPNSAGEDPSSEIQNTVNAPASNRYNTLVEIPGVTDAGELTFGAYVNVLYNLVIIAGALMAVIQLVIAGASFMVSSTNVSSRSAAKERIKGALIGLLVITMTYVILNTINPELTKVNVIEEIEPANVVGVNMGTFTQDLQALRQFAADQDVANSPTGQVCDRDDVECEVVKCPFLRLELKCSNWCKNRGGITDGSVFGNFARAAVNEGGVESIKCYRPNSKIHQDIVKYNYKIIEEEEDLPEGTDFNPATDSMLYCYDGLEVAQDYNWNISKGDGRTCEQIQELCSGGKMIGANVAGESEVIEINNPQTPGDKILICRS